MNKKGISLMIWILIIVLIVVGIGIFLLNNNEKSGADYEVEGESSPIDEIPEAEFAQVDSTDEILDEIDDALEYI
jgi:uncharacterized membrane protein